MVKDLRIILEEIRTKVEIIPKLQLILWCKNIIFVQLNIYKKIPSPFSIHKDYTLKFKP